MKENSSISLKTVAIKILCFWLCYAIAELFVGWIFRSWLPLHILWAVFWFCMACLVIIAPTISAIMATRMDGAVKEPLSPSAVQMKEDVASNNTIADIRTLRTPEIDCCFADSHFLWYWANNITIDRVYVYDVATPGKSAEGCLVMQGHHVAFIEVKDPLSGMPTRFTNKPFVEAARVARAEKDAPITAFLTSCVADAEWSWKDVENNLICISSKSLKLSAVTGKLLLTKDGSHYYAVELFNCQRKRLVPSKKSSVPAAAPSAAPTAVKAPSSVKKPAPAQAAPSEPHLTQVNIPGTSVAADDSGMSTCVSRGEDYKETPVETNISPEEEIGDAGLLRPTEDPGLSEEQLMNHARLTWADNSDTYTEYAMSAIDAGESSFLVVWPEGIQTLSEATALAQYIVKDGSYPNVEVIANDDVAGERGKLRIWLTDYYG